MKTRMTLAWLALVVAVPMLGACTVRYVVADRGQVPPEYSSPAQAPEYDPQDSASEAPQSSYVTQSEAPQENAEASLTVVLAPNEKPRNNNYIWVSPFVLGGEVAVPGFWRLRLLPGYTWVEGRLQADLGYVPGYWNPIRHRGANWEWVPGHWWGWRWLPGHWREQARTDYVWVAGHWNWEGEWIDGYWSPESDGPEGMIWEPGYWLPTGVWFEGSWRPRIRLGFAWIPREWDGRGGWRQGYWKRCKPEETWIRGHWDPQGRWQGGRLTKLEPNRELVPGHFNPRNEWVEHGWREGARKQAAEEFKNFRNAREGVQAEPAHDNSRLEEKREQAREEFNNFRDAREGGEPKPLQKEKPRSGVSPSEKRIGITVPSHQDGEDEGYDEGQEQPTVPNRPEYRPKKDKSDSSAPILKVSPGKKLGRQLGNRPNRIEAKPAVEPKEAVESEPAVKKSRERYDTDSGATPDGQDANPGKSGAPQKIRDQRESPASRSNPAADQNPNDNAANPGVSDFRKNRDR